MSNINFDSLINIDNKKFNKIKSEYLLIIEDKIRQLVDSYGYDSPESFASYTLSTNEQWSSEAKAFIRWRDAIWEYHINTFANSSLEELPNQEDFTKNIPKFIIS